MKIVLVAINAKYVHSNLAIHSLYKAASQYCESIEMAEYTINNEMDAVIRDLYLKCADVICFSCYVWNIEYVKDIAREIYKINPNIKIWFGGPEVSYDGPQILLDHPHLAGIMIGEGEYTFKELAGYYCRFEQDELASLQQIPGLMFKNGDEIVTTECRLLADLDQIPFVYDDMSLFDNKIIYYESSRGCPFRCSYCMSSIDKTVRFRSLNKVFEELHFFLDHKVPQVKFIDRTFNIQKERTLAILQFLLENDNGVTNFHFEIAADLISDDQIELLQQLRPGYVQLEIGVQSTNIETIREIHRAMDFSKVAEIVTQLKKPNNMHIHLDLIAGLPFEDMNSFINSFNMVYELRPHELQLGFLKVLKGSYMHQMAKEYGIVYGDKAPYEVLKTNWLGFDDIIRLKNVEEMLEVYYNSGLFPNTMEYLLQYFTSAFDLYDQLAHFYCDNGYMGLKHTRMTRYNILFDFMKTVDGIDLANEASQILILDLYLREDLKTRPAFALGMEEYKEQIAHLPKDVIASYKGKMCHIEPFTIDVIELLKSGRIVSKSCLVEFDYTNKHPVSKMAAAKEVIYGN